jgi:hypothetical protein
MRPYAGCDAWFVIRPSALRQSVATQPMHPARHQIVSGCSARAYPPARGHGQGLVSLPVVFPMTPEPIRLRVIPDLVATTSTAAGPAVPAFADGCRLVRNPEHNSLRRPPPVRNDPFPTTRTTKRSLLSNLQALTESETRIERCRNSAPKERRCLPQVDGLR